MSELISLTKSAKVAGEYDVVVCGGGVAGFAAAVSAARAGLKTAIVERFNCFGGTCTQGNVIPVSGFFHKEERVVGGIGWELIERLQAKGMARAEMPKGHVSANIEYTKLEMQRMLLEAGVELYTNCYLTDCIQDGGKITHAIIESKSGTEALAAKCFIDATGDGDLCHLAGAPMMEKKEELQPMSMCFLLEGADTTTDLLKGYICHNGYAGQASCNKEIQRYLLSRSDRIGQFGGPWFNTLMEGTSLAVNVTRSACDATNREDLTRAESKLREDVFTIVELLKEHYPEFKNSVVVGTPSLVGIRETRHILGEDMACGEEMISGVTYPCPVARCAHPMDIHSAKSSAQSLTYVEKPYYVPHGALIPQGSQNLLVAGRCLCADQGAYASLRVQATLMSIGECAGLMAQQCCEDQVPVSQLDVAKLAAKIAERGCVL